MIIKSTLQVFRRGKIKTSKKEINLNCKIDKSEYIYKFSYHDIFIFRLYVFSFNQVCDDGSNNIFLSEIYKLVLVSGTIMSPILVGCKYFMTSLGGKF